MRCAFLTSPIEGEHKMGITDAQKQQLDEQGCIVIPDVLSDAEIEVYRADIRRLAAEEQQNGLARQHTDGYGQHVRWLVNKGQMYEKLVAHPKVMPFFEHLLGPDYTLSTLTSNIIEPGATDGCSPVDKIVGKM
ncbi:phytanoyl-CoA dioxygenase family protein, partial [Candidatus Poribacteria bacterium]|nr:phytanoyl-CoA dioxygenase family protein [Candidatus Poribacteria bacterium]